MTLLTKSRHVALLGEQSAPRVRYAPQVRANSWEDVSDLAAAYGLVLDGWQEEVLRAGLGERSDGRWAARQVGLSTPRQNGKSQIIVARVLAGLLLFDEKTIVVSAHRQDTAREVFFRLVQVIEDNPALEERVDFIARSEMREYIRMKSGQEVRFKARSGSSGRGFSCDCLMLDEAQDLSDSSWAAILPTMSARPNPQVWLLGTPPDEESRGEVFARIRQAGIDGKARGLAYLEWSADDTDDLDDPEAWARANPALGIRVTIEACEAERAALPDDKFARERLGIWDSMSSKAWVIPEQLWAAAADIPSGPREGDITLALDSSPQGDQTSVAACAQRADGRWQVELHYQAPGVTWVPAWLSEQLASGRVRGVVYDKQCSALASLAEDFKRAGIRPTITEWADMRSACSGLMTGIIEGSVHHSGQQQLTYALSQAGKRDAEGGWAWSRRTSASDITPIVAATLALWGARNSKTKRASARARNTGRVVILA